MTADDTPLSAPQPHLYTASGSARSRGEQSAACMDPAESEGELSATLLMLVRPAMSTRALRGLLGRLRLLFQAFSPSCSISWCRRRS